jgi:hypothetical protein
LTRPAHLSKMKSTPDEKDFARLDAWARNLKIGSGRPLTAAERREENLARNVGRSCKPNSGKTK